MAFKEFIRNHQDLEVRKLEFTSLEELTELPYKTILELRENFEFRAMPFKINYNQDLLLMLSNNSMVNIYRFFGLYSALIILILMLFIPIFLSNYWLFICLLILPIAYFSGTLFFTPIKTLFYLILIILTVVGLTAGPKALLVYVLLSWSLNKFLLKAKKLFNEILIKSSLKDELTFKFLFYINVINLYDSTSDTFISKKTFR